MTDTPSQLVLDVAARHKRLTHDSFFETPANTLALNDILAAAQWDGAPRVLSGPKGAGKTHLAHIFAQITGALVLTPSELNDDSVPQARTAGAAVLDAAQDLSGRPQAQETAFHLFNQARDLRHPLLIAGRGPVRDWGLALPDLSSRLTASAQLRVTNPDERMLMMLLIKLLEDRQLAVPFETVEYAVHRMERSYIAAQALVAALDEENLRNNRRITKPMIRDILATH